MPDVDAFDVLDTYLKSSRNKACAGRVAGYDAENKPGRH